MSAITGSSAAAGATALVVSGSSQFDSAASRRDFLSYALSLMRSHNSEHSDSLPVLDVASMKHIAYVFDALIYYMRSGNDLDLKNSPPVNNPSLSVNQPGGLMDHSGKINEASNDNEAEDQMEDTGRRHIFFQRSESTLCLGECYFMVLKEDVLKRYI